MSLADEELDELEAGGNVRNVLPPTRMNSLLRTLSVARMRMACHARALLDQLHSIAIAADALVKAVVFSSDLAVEVRGGGTLRGAGVGDGLSCRSQIIFVQQLRGFALGRGVSGIRSFCLSLDREGSAHGH